MSEELEHRQPNEDDPIGEMKLPGRPSFGARVYALAGSATGLGVVAVMGVASETTTITPTPITTR